MTLLSAVSRLLFLRVSTGTTVDRLTVLPTSDTPGSGAPQPRDPKQEHKDINRQRLLIDLKERKEENKKGIGKEGKERRKVGKSGDT